MNKSNNYPQQSPFLPRLDIEPVAIVRAPEDELIDLKLRVTQLTEENVQLKSKTIQLESKIAQLKQDNESLYAELRVWQTQQFIPKSEAHLGSYNPDDEVLTDNLAESDAQPSCEDPIQSTSTDEGIVCGSLVDIEHASESAVINQTSECATPS